MGGGLRKTGGVGARLGAATGAASRAAASGKAAPPAAAARKAVGKRRASESDLSDESEEESEEESAEESEAEEESEEASEEDDEGEDEGEGEEVDVEEEAGGAHDRHAGSGCKEASRGRACGESAAEDVESVALPQMGGAGSDRKPGGAIVSSGCSSTVGQGSEAASAASGAKRSKLSLSHKRGH